MFRQLDEPSRASALELVNAVKTIVQKGGMKQGDDFPTPEEIARNSGVPLSASLEAVTLLLQSGQILQDASGQLWVR